MPPPTTAVFFSGTIPAAPPGLQNTVPQTDGAQPAQRVSEYMPGPSATRAGAVLPDGITIILDPDGITIHAPGVGGTVGPGGGGAGLGAPVVPAGAKDGSNTSYTLPAPVLAGTNYLYVTDGVVQRQLGTEAEFAVQGTQLTRLHPLQSDDWHEFYYTQGVPNSEGGGGGGVNPTTLGLIRGTNSITNTFGATTRHIVLTFPAGTQAGDLAVLFSLTTANVANVPSGWTSLAATAATWGGFVASKILTSGDISTGNVSVDVGASFGTNGDAIAEIVTFVGPTSGIRETDAALDGTFGNTGNPPAPGTMATTSAVLSSDVGVFFAGCALPASGATIACASGTTLQSPNTSDAMGVLAVGTMPGGVSNILFPTTGAFLGNGMNGAVVIVIP